MKNISILILLTASSLALAGCGGSNQGSSAQNTGAALTSQSIADDLIRPEVKTLTKESTQKVMSERDKAKQEKIAQQVFAEYQSLLKTSTNQQERDLLQMYTNSFSKMIEIYKIEDEAQRAIATQQVFTELIPEQRSFFQKYIQSAQLRSLVLQLQSLGQEKMYLEQRPEKQLERKAHEEKIISLAKQMIDLYDNPNLDAQTKAEIAALDEIGLLPKSMIESLRRFAYPTSEELFSRVPNLSEKVSLRRTRQEGASVDLSQLMVNGAAGSGAQLGLPLYVQLKGVIESSKDTKDLTGVAVYKLNNTLVGIIHGYANASNNSVSSLNHHETSAVVSQSFGKAYIEGQAGFVKSRINQMDVNGGRYQLTAGYDFDAVTPFVQTTFRNINNVAEHAVYAGCELDIMHIITDGYTVSGRVTVKGGHHSLKGTVGSVEGSGAIQLNDGLKVETAINLAGGESPTARVGFSIDQ